MSLPPTIEVLRSKRTTWAGVNHNFPNLRVVSSNHRGEGNLPLPLVALPLTQRATNLVRLHLDGVTGNWNNVSFPNVEVAVIESFAEKMRVGDVFSPDRLRVGMFLHGAVDLGSIDLFTALRVLVVYGEPPNRVGLTHAMALPPSLEALMLECPFEARIEGQSWSLHLPYLKVISAAMLIMINNVRLEIDAPGLRCVEGNEHMFTETTLARFMEADVWQNRNRFPASWSVDVKQGGVFETDELPEPTPLPGYDAEWTDEHTTRLIMNAVVGQ
jgi:hypothetical protein